MADCGSQRRRKSNRKNSLDWRSWSVTRWRIVFRTLKSYKKNRICLLSVRNDFEQNLSETANTAEKILALSGSSETPPPFFQPAP